MGCDWSKSAGSFEDLHDAPYSLLSVTIEEGGGAQLRSGKRGSAKKKDKRRARDTKPDPVEVPKSSSAGQQQRSGVHKSASGLSSLNLPARQQEGANRRNAQDELIDEAIQPNKENARAPALGGLGGKLGLGLKLDLSKAINQGREPTERQLRKEKLDRYLLLVQFHSPVKCVLCDACVMCVCV
jgi:hypothetical protein